MTSEKLYRHTLKCTAKVEKENSCSPWTTNSFTRLFKCETWKFKITLYFQGFSRKKVKFQFMKRFLSGARQIPLISIHTHRLRKVKKVIHGTCLFHHTWISDVGENIYIQKLEKDKQISPNWFFQYDPNMPGFANSGRRNYQEEMSSLQVPRIWNHQQLLNTYKANLFIIDSQGNNKAWQKGLKIQAKSCDLILNPE